MFKRNDRGGVYYPLNKQTKERQSFGTTDKNEAQRLLDAENQAQEASSLNLQLGDDMSCCRASAAALLTHDTAARATNGKASRRRYTGGEKPADGDPTQERLHFRKAINRQT